MKFVSVQGNLSLRNYNGFSFIFPKIRFRCNLTHFESENFSDSSFYPIFESENFRFLFFSKPGECNVKNLTSENRRKIIST